jgi:hypothetical protein
MNYTKEEIDGLISKVLENPDDRFVRMVYMDCLLAMSVHLSVETSFAEKRDTYIESGILYGLGNWNAREHLSKCQNPNFCEPGELNVVGEVIEKALSEQK